MIQSKHLHTIYIRLLIIHLKHILHRLFRFNLFLNFLSVFNFLHLLLIKIVINNLWFFLSLLCIRFPFFQIVLKSTNKFLPLIFFIYFCVLNSGWICRSYTFQFIFINFFFHNRAPWNNFLFIIRGFSHLLNALDLFNSAFRFCNRFLKNLHESWFFSFLISPFGSDFLNIFLFILLLLIILYFLFLNLFLALLLRSQERLIWLSMVSLHEFLIVS